MPWYFIFLSLPAFNVWLTRVSSIDSFSVDINNWSKSNKFEYFRNYFTIIDILSILSCIFYLFKGNIFLQFISSFLTIEIGSITDIDENDSMQADLFHPILPRVILFFDEVFLFLYIWISFCINYIFK